MKEKTKIFLDKTSYIFEFIFSLVYMFSIYEILIDKHYYGYTSKLQLITSIISFFIVVAIIIYNFISFRNKIEKCFLNVAIPLSLGFMVFIIPGQAPDDLAHMVRTYELSEGHLFTPKDENGDVISTVPEDLLKYTRDGIDNYYKLEEESDTDTDYNKTRKYVSSANGYSFVLYIVPAIGFFIGRVFNLNLVIAIYLARILNTCLFIICGYFIIKKVPFGKLLMSVYLLTPMMLQQMTSFSADVVVNLVCLYFISNLVNLLLKDNMNRNECIEYFILSFLMGMVKIAYGPLVGIGLLFIFNKNMSKKKKAFIIIFSIALALTGMLMVHLDQKRCHTMADSVVEYNRELNVDSSKQISSIIENPKHVFKAYYYEWTTNLIYYIDTVIGSKLGWLEIEINDLIILGFIILILASIVFENNKFELSKISKAWMLIVSLGIVLLIGLSLYVTFTPIGAEYIGGIQGRYFIPIFIIGLLCLCPKENYIKTEKININIAFTMIAMFLNLPVLVTIFNFFI